MFLDYPAPKAVYISGQIHNSYHIVQHWSLLGEAALDDLSFSNQKHCAKCQNESRVGGFRAGRIVEAWGRLGRGCGKVSRRRNKLRVPDGGDCVSWWALLRRR